MVLRMTEAFIRGRLGRWNILVLMVTSSILNMSFQEGWAEENLHLMKDENPNTPYFMGTPYEGNIPITANVGQHVLTVEAFDDDQLETCNANVRYSIHPDQDTSALAHFAVDLNTGEVFVAKRFGNAESGNLDTLTFEFTVRATDNGCWSRYNETLVKMFVWAQPIFDVPGQFHNMATRPIEGDLAQSWCEEIPQAVYNGPHTGPIYYKIDAGDKNDHFTINETTGMICNKVELDREETAGYHLLVVAFFNHSGSGAHTNERTPLPPMVPDHCKDLRLSELCVFLKVEDINDNPPIFQKDTYAIGIYFDILLGTKIMKITADDADIGNSSALLYEMKGGPSQFAIEKWSGSIYLAEPLDNNKLSTFEFTVKATDDFGNGVSSLRDTNVEITTTSIQNLIVLTTSLSNKYTKAHSHEIVRDLEEQLGLDVAILDIGPSLSDERQILVNETDIWYTCTYPQTHSVVAGEDVLAKHLGDKFRSKWAVRTISQGNTNRWKTTAGNDRCVPIWIIVLLVVILAVPLILVIAYASYLWKRLKKRSTTSIDGLNGEGSKLPNEYNQALPSSRPAMYMEVLSPPSPPIKGKNGPKSPPKSSVAEVCRTKALSCFLPARELQRDELENKEQLGAGHYGIVNKALLQRTINTECVAIEVAVKSLRDSYDVDNTEAFTKELKVLASLKQHQNVILLLGYCTAGDPLLLVFEFAPNGDLVKYLKKHREGLSQERLVKFALDVTKGMEYLSSKSIIHRDLAARNVLVGDNEICKIADFGLSRIGEIYCPTAQTEIPVFWTAPECINVSQPIYNQRTDVWSFGVVLWEIMSFGRRPYYEGTPKDIVVWLEKGNRLTKPTKCLYIVHEVMKKCWRRNPKDRPKFKKLTREIDNIHCYLGNYLINTSSLNCSGQHQGYENVNYGGQQQGSCLVSCLGQLHCQG
ncbi:uncharacterized protein [Ptychodera flava]|uniref:uncharacterized protein n=1 Tax=Ptychodera flava TaxID=63121 RepID=UPI003969D696